MEIKKLSCPFELKAISDDGVFEGYGAVFGNEDSQGDIIVKGAFAKTLEGWREKGKYPAICWQHNMDNPLGPYEEMREDEHGLFVRGRLLKDDVQLAREAYALLKHNAINGLSIGYSTVASTYDKATDIRLLSEVKLWEVSIVTVPANDRAVIESVKSINTVTDLERVLRDAGHLSRKEAKEVVCRVKNSMRDACSLEDIKTLINKNIEILRG